MLDVLLSRDRWITLAGLSAVTLLAWIWLLHAPAHRHPPATPPAGAASPMPGEEEELLP